MAKIELTAKEKALLVGRFTKWTNYEPKIENITEVDVNEYCRDVMTVNLIAKTEQVKEFLTNTFID